MSKSIFEESASEKLANIFTSMTRPQAVVAESNETGKGLLDRKLVTEGLEDEEEIFQDEPIGGGLDDDIEDDLSELDDDFDKEGEMVEVPRELLDQLVTFLEDPMDEEETSDVDDIDFEIPEESIEYSTLKSLYSTTQKGSPKQKNKTKPSSKGGVYTGVGGKERTGKAEILKSIIISYLKQNGKATEKTKWSAGQSWVKK